MMFLVMNTFYLFFDQLIGSKYKVEFFIFHSLAHFVAIFTHCFMMSFNDFEEGLPSLFNTCSIFTLNLVKFKETTSTHI